MPKEIVRVPGISDALEKANVPLSSAVKANGFVFCSGMPPMNPETGEIVRGDIETQTRAVLDSLKAVLPFDILSLSLYSVPAEGDGLSSHVRSVVDVCYLDPVPPNMKPPAEYYKVWYHLPPSEEMAQLLRDRENRLFSKQYSDSKLLLDIRSP